MFFLRNKIPRPPPHTHARSDCNFNKLGGNPSWKTDNTRGWPHDAHVVWADTSLSTGCISLQITFWSAGLLLPSWWERWQLKLTTTSGALALRLSNHEWRPSLFWWHLLSFHCLFWNVKPWLFQTISKHCENQKGHFDLLWGVHVSLYIKD